MSYSHHGRLAIGAALMLGIAGLAGCSSAEAGKQQPSAQPGTAEPSSMPQGVQKMQELDHARGYLVAHDHEQNPLELLGGPIDVSVKQVSGGVFVALPDHRRRDPSVFGPIDMPQHYDGTPVITGAPPPIWEKAADGGYQTRVLTPFGDKYTVLPNGHLSIDAVDATATDAAVSKDRVRFDATWQDKAGNTYEVKCCAKLATHGLEFPTFGGVATNLLLHGFSGVGTPLMPTEFTYFAFWGFGEVDKNGQTLDKPRLIHGMLTEYVRTQGYKLGFDKDVTPTREQFHLMIAPMKPDPAKGVFEPSPVNTGFTLPNGKELPFWHVMFENLEINAKRG